MSENNDISERCHSLSEKLRDMLDEKLGDGWERRRNPAKRTICVLFGISYAHEIDELRGDDEWEKFAGFVIAGRAGLTASSYGPLIHTGQDLAKYVNAKGENQSVAADVQYIRKGLDNLTERVDTFLDALKEDE